MATVRYAGSSGVKVRSTAAGTVVLTLDAGALMYDIAGVSTVTKSLNGTSYVWVKVHYYDVNTSETTEGTGWVAKKYTTQVSTTSPTKSDAYSSNSVLTQNKMLTNARYIYNYLKDEGWTSNAIYGMLGNMEEESYINPGRWQNGTQSTSNGYGLTQWTPPTKLTNWLSSGADKSDIDNQLKRILYEVENEDEQWVSSNHSPAMTFSAYTTSSKSCSVLAEYFVRCYENPSSVDSKVSERQSHATKWKKLIGYLE